MTAARLNATQVTGRPPGFTILEAAVAVAVLGVGLLAAQELVVHGVRTMAAEHTRVDSTLLAQTLLAEARLDPEGPRPSEGTTDRGLAFVRSVRDGPDPLLVEVRVRTRAPGVPGSTCEVVEVMRAAP
jgi:type II secretory pathway pseudopilin PulG